MKEYLILYNDEIFSRSECYITAKNKKQAKKYFIKSMTDHNELCPDTFVICKVICEIILKNKYDKSSP